MNRHEPTPKFQVEWLTALSDTDVEFSTLEDDVLTILAQDNELYFATAAMAELHRRRSPKAAEIARSLLTSGPDDVYLKATALGTSFDLDLDWATGYSVRNLANFPEFLVAKLIEIAIATPHNFAYGDGAQLVKLVLDRLTELVDPEPCDPDSIKTFKEIFANQNVRG